MVTSRHLPYCHIVQKLPKLPKLVFCFTHTLAFCLTRLIVLTWHLSLKPRAGFNLKKAASVCSPFPFSRLLRPPLLCLVPILYLTFGILHSKCTIRRGDAVGWSQNVIASSTRLHPSVSLLRALSAQGQRRWFNSPQCHDWGLALAAQKSDTPAHWWIFRRS